jgi:hypothetical protein
MGLDSNQEFLSKTEEGVKKPNQDIADYAL